MNYFVIIFSMIFMTFKCSPASNFEPISYSFSGETGLNSFGEKVRTLEVNDIPKGFADNQENETGNTGEKNERSYSYNSNGQFNPFASGLEGSGHKDPYNRGPANLVDDTFRNAEWNVLIARVLKTFSTFFMDTFLAQLLRVMVPIVP